MLPYLDAQDTLAQIASHKPGTTVKLAGLRGSQPFTLSLVAIDTPTAR